MLQQNLIQSKRLKAIAQYLPKGALFADIGSDHAYLPCYICLNDLSARAIAVEINEGPYRSAVKTIKQVQLSSVIEARLGNGLRVIDKGEINHLVVAGMGGALIKEILNDGKQKLDTVERIIVQPNVDERTIRKWLTQHDYQITNENIMEEKGHIYEIIVANKNAHPMSQIKLSDHELFFGPYLLNEKSAIFLKKWKQEYRKRIQVIRQMKQAKMVNKRRVEQFLKELDWIKEVLGDEEID